MDGLMPTTFALFDGARMLPRVSVPRAAKDKPMAAAIAEPLEEPCNGYFFTSEDAALEG